MDCMRLDALQEDDEVRANLAKELGLSADKTNSNAGQSVSDMDAWEREMKAELEGELPCPRFLPTGSRFNYTAHRYYVRLKAVRSWCICGRRAPSPDADVGGAGRPSRDVMQA